MTRVSDIVIYMIYLLTVIGLTPSGSSTVHIHTQTIHTRTQSTQTMYRATQLTGASHKKDLTIL
jgi:hypothetical protein